MHNDELAFAAKGHARQVLGTRASPLFPSRLLVNNLKGERKGLEVTQVLGDESTVCTDRFMDVVSR